jgi:daunorubicin resistance ABC transporter ATP-binding subunit
MTDRVTVEEPPGIAATGLVKAFGTVTALDGVDLTVTAGTLAALLGPNGAGKTTLVRIIATLSRPDAGQVRVFGHDVTRQPGQVRSRIGLTGQYAGLDEELRGRDNLVLIGRLAGLRRREARQRAGELADALGLAHAADRAVRTYSGGMRRRLDLAASLMTRPPLLILDEPTTGLDPAGRQQLWATLGELRAQGTTMLLTTQYLEEADRFADVVHVLNRGRIIASGTATQLKALVGGRVAEIRLADPTAVPGAARDLAKRLALAPDEIRADAGGGLLTVAAPDGTATLLAAAAALAAAGIVADDLGLRQPSLDEAFLTLTGDGDVTGVPA